jgi:4-hydroxybenzoate polyprenyltransferase
VNTAYPFAAAYLVSGGRNPWLLILGTLYFLIPYNLMMYGINDVFDYESDIRNPRKGGVEGATASRQLHRPIIVASILASVPFLIYLWGQGHPLSQLWLTYLVFMVLAYSAPHLRFKERPFLDSFTSATHFAGPLVYALLLTGLRPSYLAAIAAFFAWGMASHALGAVQDIIPDREGWLESVATVIGAKLTIRLVVGAYLLAGCLLLAYGWPGAIVGLTTLAYAHNAARFWLITDAKSGAARAAWRRFLWLNYVVGFIITLVLIWRLWR